MGQRLNMEMIMNGETVANAYYHWSAYTSSSLRLTQMVLEKQHEIQHENAVLRAIRLLEVTGALLNDQEIKAANELFPNEQFSLAESRNEGLIAITEKGIDETREWEEGRVEIDFDNETVDFSVFWSDDKDNYLKDYEKEEEDYEKMPIRHYDFSAISFKKFNEFANDLWAIMEEGHYELRLQDGDVVSFIE